MSRWGWAFIVLVLLLAWGLRLCCLEKVPPGWRDDELINIHALSSRVLDGEFPLYYLGASGHEPLYHHLHAGLHAVLGFNVLSGHILSVSFGTLSVALTYALTRRLFPETRAVASVASLSLATSFWSLMYSRTAIRHISLPPLVLATLYVLWGRLEADSSRARNWIPVGILLAASLYTYTASRLLPVLVIALSVHPAVYYGRRLRGQGRGIALAIFVMALLVAPMGVAIVQGRSEWAVEGIGADARVTQLAEPVRSLRGGNARPFLIHVVNTLGMFHASGDPEWLYNIPGRPVFNLLGASLLWIGVAICLYHWRQLRCFCLLAWFGLGLTPAFVSTPPASLGHTIFAQPVAHIFPALAAVEICYRLGLARRGRLIHLSKTAFLSTAAVAAILGAFVVSNAARDLRDYFIVWPQRGMVRLLYRADQREAARYLDGHPEITDVAIGSALMGPWDRVALEVDLRRKDVAARLFNPERALIWPAGDRPVAVLLPTWPDPSSSIEALLGSGMDVAPHLVLYAPSVRAVSSSGTTETMFDNGLKLTDVRWPDDSDLRPGQPVEVLTIWRVAEPLDLPPAPIIAQPPPPRTYTGSRLSVYAHLLDAEGRLLAGDDGLWVDPITLRPGDHFLQLHRFDVPAERSEAPAGLALGLYDPKTDERWPRRGGDGTSAGDLVYIPVGEQP